MDKLLAMREAYNRGNVDEAAKYLDPDVELRPAVVGMDLGGPCRGRDQVLQYITTVNDAWESVHVEVQETIEGPGDCVFAVDLWSVRGRDGIELEFQAIDVYRFRDGLFVRIDGFTERAPALEAAGLSE